MKYKLLSEKGMQLVCLEDGTKIPFQISTTVEQYCNDSAIVTVVAYCDKKIGVGNIARLYFDAQKQTICLLDIELEDLLMLSLAYRNQLSVCEFSVVCEIVDTIEKPIDLNKK